jgi:hypothetical protein
VAHSADLMSIPDERVMPPVETRDHFTRFLLRFVIAIAVSAAVDLLWWLREPRHLSGNISIVGYPTFNNWDYAPAFTAYRLVVYAFPIGALVVYALLAWRGPLRRAPRPPRGVVALRTVDAPDEAAVSPSVGVLSLAGRLALPTLVVLVAASAHRLRFAARIDRVGVASAIVYLVGVALLAYAVMWWRVRPQRWHGRSYLNAVSLANGVAGSVAALVALWFVSRHSVVIVGSNRTQHFWGWLPWWLVGLAVITTLAWTLWRIRGGYAYAAVERRLLTVVVGSVLIFLAVSTLPGQLGSFQGFDDAQTVSGASLLSRGLFPWRDQLFIHGLYQDILSGVIGVDIFGDTRWGVVAGVDVVLYPLTVVILYLFAVWLARRNTWFLVGAAVFLLAMPLENNPAPRFVLVPAALVLLGEVLKRRSRWWCALFMVVLFAQTIAIPETSYLALPALLVVVAADFVHREPGQRTVQKFYRTVWCAVVGAALIIAWFLFLLASDSVRGFIDYYRFFALSHSVGSAVPPGHISRIQYLMFGIGIALVLMTFWMVAIRIRGRHGWTPRDWVTVAAAGFVALYNEKAIGRFDAPHVIVGFGATIPLLLLWLERAIGAADVAVGWIDTKLRSMRGAGREMLWRPVSILALILAVAAYPSLKGRTLWSAVNWIPGRMHATAAHEPSVPHLGYAADRAVNSALLKDLGAALDTYAGKDAAVFDMSDGPGYIYYLLQRQPGTRFTHIDVAKAPSAQDSVIKELKQSRPPVIVFDGSSIGLPVWDGIRTNVRAYKVSKYVLDGWEPILQTNGELLLLRRDLMAGRPPVPQLTTPAQTTGLWFSAPACAWGSVPNFLRSEPTGTSVDVPVTTVGTGTLAAFSGWAVNGNSRSPALSVVMARDGKAVATAPVNVPRPDLVPSLGAAAANAGYSVGGFVPRGSGPVTVLALTSDGLLHPIGGQTAGGMTSVRMADGTLRRVGAPVPGFVDSGSTRNGALGVATVPAGVTLADYDLLTLSAGGDIAPADLTVSDSLTAGANHEITAHALPASGKTLSIRVGSCLQWHGYPSGKLYVFQSAGSPVKHLAFSGVR